MGSRGLRPRRRTDRSIAIAAEALPLFDAEYKPFLWGENEYVIDICADYILLANAVNDLLGG